MKKIIFLIATIAVSLCADAQQKSTADKFGALAIDRSNGFYYGWAYDYATLREAETKALTECRKKGGSCSIVLTFSGAGCAAYRTIKNGTAYGWGVAKTKEAADAIAIAECKKRSKGVAPANYVWACNSATAAPLKEIFNAKNELAGADVSVLPSSQSVDYSIDGKKLAVAGGDGKVRILAVPTYKLLTTIDIASKEYFGELQQVVFSPDGKTIATGHGRHSKILLWDASNGKLLRTFEQEWYGNPSLSFSPDGKLLASGGDCRWSGESCPGKIYIWEVATGKLIHNLTGHNRNLSSSAFSPDGKILATTGSDGSVIFWNPETGSKISSFMANNDQVNSGKFSPDGKTYVTISWDGDEKTKLWNVATGKNILTLPSHGTYGESVAFYDNGKKLVTIGMNEKMFLWDLSNGSKLASATEVPYWGISVAPDGTIATGGAGGVQLYTVDGSNFKLLKNFKRQ